ncbi:MAG: amidohydrolase family protein, partial [Bacteroidota bacterium]|nr:amidohydrolase family protein [Bacteroidota bacterium]
MKTISGHIVDVVSRQIFDGVIQIEGNRINAIIAQKNVEDQYIIPGFIDAHIHIESSMMLPAEFARLALP